MALTRGYLVGPGTKESFPVLSSSTFKEGDFVYFDSSGRLQQLIAVSTAYTTELLVGQANENALNDQGVVKPYASVTIFQPGTRFVLPLYSATPASAVPNPNLLQNAGYGCYNTASGFPAVNLDDTTNKKFRIVGLLEEDYPGWPTYNGAGTVQYARVIVEPLGAAAQLWGGR